VVSPAPNDSAATHADPQGDRHPEAHPGPASAPVPAALVRQLIDHARDEYPNEACGLIVGDRPAADGGRPLRFEPTRNAAASPLRYEIDSADLLRISIAADDRDEVFWGIVHSHVRSAAQPSPTDIGLAFYPDALYVLVTLSEAPEAPGLVPGVSVTPFVRAWRILDGRVWEVELEVTE
ncbi:MAG TPA: M67 family metallopeptidase, partial [Candidatus Saccharimonadales bacterium]|nr:M67 family metallopeptidase [Candidatus Saccharimonadales bacterium]